MQHSYKVLLNLFTSYLRIIINSIVTLISTRIALNTLGVSDFGLYNLLSGFVSLLSFINGSLLISSQRYFSICIGRKEFEKLNKYFNCSLGIHIILAVILAIVLFLVEQVLFEYVINIEESQLQIAKTIYDIMVLSTIITIGSIPYSAMMTAKEDMNVLASIDIISSFIRLFAAVILLYLESDLLLIYSLINCFAILQKLICEYLWNRFRYKESLFHVSLLIDKRIYKEMVGFVSWNTLGSSSTVIRNQGIALLLNYFYGITINAAYGIANQVNSLVLSFASTLTNVFTPMIVQAHGENKNMRMLYIAILSSKLSFILSTLMALPILIFLDPILRFWLGNVPDYTLSICRYLLINFVIMQLTPGINRVIYAIGKIRKYQIVIFVVTILIIPMGYLLFYLSFDPTSIFVLMCMSQFILLIVTIYNVQLSCRDFDSKHFIVYSVFKPVVFFVIFYCISSCLFNNIIAAKEISSIIVSSIIVSSVYLLLCVYLILNSSEKKQLLDVYYSFYYRILKS